MSIMKEEAKAEAAAYINNLLGEYTRRTIGVRLPPRWEWQFEYPFFVLPLPRSTPVEEQTIYVSEPVVVWWWMRDKEKAKKALRFAISHEYWHTVQIQRGTQRWFGRQRVAEIKSVRLSGVTIKEFEDIIGELMTVKV